MLLCLYSTQLFSQYLKCFNLTSLNSRYLVYNRPFQSIKMNSLTEYLKDWECDNLKLKICGVDLTHSPCVAGNKYCLWMSSELGV